MMKKLLKVLRSTWLMTLLLSGLAISIAVGTFIEHHYGTNAARILVYNARWFEALLLLIPLNFILNIRRYGLFRQIKWPILLTHLSFIIIIMGAFITRYYGMEGLMSIREGERSREILTDNTYLSVRTEVHSGDTLIRKTIERPVLLSQATTLGNNFTVSEEFLGRSFKLSYKDFQEDVEPYLLETQEGNTYLKIVEAASDQKITHFLMEGDIMKLGDTFIAFNQPRSGAINIYTVGTRVNIESPYPGRIIAMNNSDQRELLVNKSEPVNHRALYEINGIPFVLPELPVRAKVMIKPVHPSMRSRARNALKLILNTSNDSKEIIVFGKKQAIGKPHITVFDGITYTISYGSKKVLLPFEIQLNDFVADKYPGTQNSYAAFKSFVSVVDSTRRYEEEISMNNVLDYRGYRFFQASFHPDERGTILSVSRDAIGTQVTYVGYFMLYFGLVLTLFNKKSRFYFVSKRLKQLNKGKVLPIMIFLILSGSIQEVWAQDLTLSFQVKEKLDSIVKVLAVPEQHALEFGKLAIQDKNGRMKPVNTYASELLRKLSKRNNYNGLSPEQVLLGLMQHPKLWYNVPIIHLKKANDSLRRLLNVPEESNHVPLAGFFEDDGAYRLEKQVNEAYLLLVPDQFAKDFVDVDRKVHLLYETIKGQSLRIFPLEGDANNTWVAPNSPYVVARKARDTVFINQIFNYYLQLLNKARADNDYSEANDILAKIKNYQMKYGAEVRPSHTKIASEILYNRMDLFNRLFLWYASMGILLIMFAIIALFHNGKFIQYTQRGLRILIVLCFLLHTAGLLFRWYISGHAPWSDAYETMIYISWATLFFALVFLRKSFLGLGASAFVVSMILMVAHWNWLDPAIANLQPVLNSYWLMIHVALIVASYGPFTLAAVLGVLCLMLMLFLNKRNHEKIGLQIAKLTLTTELTITIGLTMLIIGNFLGAQWANESWGRYWAWDPKETWALVSILIYAVIIHLRLVPQLRGSWLFSMMSIIGFYAILMTYFGVNFYLSGLHSYAQGDQILTTPTVFLSIVLFLSLGLAGYFKQRQYL